MPRIARTIDVHGFALREIRESRGRKVADLAAALDVDRSYITHLENGSKRRVSPEVFAGICNELTVHDRRALLLDPYALADEAASA